MSRSPKWRCPRWHFPKLATCVVGPRFFYLFTRKSNWKNLQNLKIRHKFHVNICLISPDTRYIDNDNVLTSFVSLWCIYGICGWVGLWMSWSVDEMTCGWLGLWTSWSVDEMVYGRDGMDELVCGRDDLRPYRIVWPAVWLTMPIAYWTADTHRDFSVIRKEDILFLIHILFSVYCIQYYYWIIRTWNCV